LVSLGSLLVKIFIGSKIKTFIETLTPLLEKNCQLMKMQMVPKNFGNLEFFIEQKDRRWFSQMVLIQNGGIKANIMEAV